MAHGLSIRDEELTSAVLFGPRRGPHSVDSNPRGKAAAPEGVHPDEGPGVLKRFSGVLVVDDDDGIRRQLSYLLEDEGYHVEVVATGLAALSAAQESSFDVVILDVRLPDVSGIEVFEAFRRRSDSIKTIIVSGFLVDEEIAAAEHRGAHFLAKPVDSTRLLSLLATLERAKGEPK